MKKLTKQQIKKITNELITFYLYNLTKEMYINDGYYIDMFEFFFVLIDEGTLPEFEMNQYYMEIGQEPFRYIPLDNVIENVKKYISEKTLNLKKGATVLNLFEGYITKQQERNMILKQSIDRLYAREISKEEYDKIWKIKEDKRNKSKEDNNNEELNENNIENIKGIIKFPNGMTFESDNLKEEDMEEFQKHLKKIMDKATMIDPKVMDESLSRLSNMDQEEIEKMNEMAQKLFGNFGSFGNPFGGNVEEIGLDEDNQERIENDSENGKDSKIDKEKKITKEEKRVADAKKFLDSFGTNLNEKAKHGQIDKVIGREKEIERLVEILNRRKKNNPCIIGEPGVGKTALAQGLALRIVEGNVPAKLMDKEIYLLDMGALVAGTQFRGQFEGRLERLVKECKFLGNIVLVIDEIHTITKLRRRRKFYKCSKYIKASFSKPEICRL